MPKRSTSILVHSGSSSVRRRVIEALPASAEVEEAATREAVIKAVECLFIDAVILDGKSGGLGLCHQLRNEVFQAPPVIMLVERREDEWLARWSGAKAVLRLPVDPLTLATALEEL